MTVSATDRLRRRFREFLDLGLVENPRTLFNMADSDGDGAISFTEFSQAVTAVSANAPNVQLTTRELQQAWRVLDANHDDCVSEFEFVTFCEGRRGDDAQVQ